MRKRFDPGIRMTLQTMKVLRPFLDRPNEELAGADLQRITGLASGTLYPILLRLEHAGWFTSRWENVKAEQAGRPRRRFYQITPNARVQAERAFDGLLPGAEAYA